MKILIVEDVKAMAMAAKAIVSLAKHEVDIAATPTEAKKAVSNNSYDAIFMDFGLPEMDGLKLTSILRSEGYMGLIIGLTANSELFTLEQMKAAGLNACLEKPLSPIKLSLLEKDPNSMYFDLEFD